MRLINAGIIIALAGIAAPGPDPAAAESVQISTSGSGVPQWKRVRYGNPRALELRSQVGLVVDEREGTILYARDVDKPRPIASLTKLLTIMTLIDAKLSHRKLIEITRQDRDRLKASRSRLRFGTTLSRGELMHIAIMASDNRATAALARTYPGGSEALIRSVNDKAGSLGLSHTRVLDASGLRAGNVSTARDLARLAFVARDYPAITRWSTTRILNVTDRKSGKVLKFRNTNSLIHRKRWDISLSKTGFTSEAGNCLLMRTIIADRPLIIVLLNSWGKLSKYGDSGRIRDWIVSNERATRFNEDQASAASALDGNLVQVTAGRSHAVARPGKAPVVRYRAQ